MVVSFATTQEAIDATYKRVRWHVLIGGIVTDCLDVTTRHDVDAPIGTCSLSLKLPLPEHVTFGASVEVQAGYPGAVHTLFRGAVASRRQSISRQGRTAQITATSHAVRLAREDLSDVVFNGPITLKALFEGLAARRGVTLYRSDETTAPDGVTPITFGNSLLANGQTVRIRRKTPTLDFLTRAARLVGYRVFDTPQGVRQQRINGLPNASAAIEIAEAWNALGLDYDDDIEGLVNYWEVFGDRYIDDDGVNVELRSIPLEVPTSPELEAYWGSGWARKELSDDLIDTEALADIVRNVAEIDHGAPAERVSWETHGAPDLMPGDVADVRSDSMALSGLQWVMRVEHNLSMSGFRTTCEGWRGSGSALPAGEDCIVTPIPGGPFRLGDEYVAWYAIPSSGNRTQITIPFNVHEYYSSIAVYGLAHGVNSQYIGGANEDLEISKFELWQHGEKVGSGNLPILDENYSKRLPYGSSDTYWDRFVVPISGRLEPGSAELRIIAGENRNLPTGTKMDDFELKDLVLRTCGVGLPVLPGEVA